jgi:hypothetical protein
MNSQKAFVLAVDEARILEPVHEEANTRPRGAHHLCQRLMTHLRNRSLGCSMAIEVREQQGNTCQSFLARTAMLVN